MRGAGACSPGPWTGGGGGVGPGSGEGRTAGREAVVSASVTGAVRPSVAGAPCAVAAVPLLAGVSAPVVADFAGVSGPGCCCVAAAEEAVAVAVVSGRAPVGVPCPVPVLLPVVGDVVSIRTDGRGSADRAGPSDVVDERVGSVGEL